MILAKPENREKLIYFMGIERVRYRRAVHPGDQVVIEAVVRRLRSRMGVLRRRARQRPDRRRRHDDIRARPAERGPSNPAVTTSPLKVRTLELPSNFRKIHRTTSRIIPSFTPRDVQTAHFASG